ncbi:MAG TPA: NADH-quinone oxidoreductase subunit NuoF [archaeon]|nr:NADH-quinone oxidoreductase subunit NuoF [archaeon]
MMVCGGTSCVSNKSYIIKKALEREIEKHGLEDEIQVGSTGCFGFCAQGPVIMVRPDSIYYHLLKEEDIPRIVKEHLIKGIPLKEKIYIPPEEKIPVPKMDDLDFFNCQRLIAFRNRGIIDPENIEDYIAHDGYIALAKALTSMTPEEIIQEVKKAGLRGRGGAGFLTAHKWELCRVSENGEKYVVCNADEGDPGAYMDRSIVESDPHSVLEGMALGARAIGASVGFVFIRHEYPIALETLNKAIKQARDYGLLGDNILGTDFCFDVYVHRSAGAFVCGEETALMASLEGRVGEPWARPPYPVEKGLWYKPTNINNVETWANIPIIISRGGDWFSQIGTETSKGTKVFSLVGKINNTGLVEVPMGITMRDIIYKIGGGIANGKRFKAIQTGGPSGGCIPEELLDLPVDFESLREAGSMMGSGGMVVMDEDTCMVDIARYFMRFLMDESCGKCTPCREGIIQMYLILENICNGEAKPKDLDLLQELAQVVKKASLCQLGLTAPNPVLSTMKYFKEEYETHVKEGRCPAGVCKALVTYEIDQEKCNGCMVCAKNCPVEAISGANKMPHVIDQDKCTKCGFCYDVCKFDAILHH